MLTKADSYKNQKHRHTISDRSFDKMLSSVKLLSPMQLMFLQEQIQGSLKHSDSPLLTNEELDTIASLFE